MWFVLSLIALLCWSGSDMFSKIGSKPSDKLSHWKMVMAVGLVMGLHAAYEIFVGGVEISWGTIIAYLPASFMYILSMTIGYVGLRYIELSVSSPICNSSGGIAAVLCFLFLQEMPGLVQWIGVAAVTVGVVLLGVAEMNESDDARQLRQQNSKIKYEKSFIALLLPILYCIIDALGTFFDSVILREEATGTFLACGIVAAIYVLGIRRDKLTVKAEGPKLLGGVFETAGQLAYIYALGDTAHAGFAAAIIASYCALSVVWSRIFLKEKLSWKHYGAIALTVAGIIILGVFDA